MKTIILNASPRKNNNTAQLLREAERGAQSAGSETEFVNLYDLQFTGCRSCLACKRAGAERCRCFWPDDLSPLIEKIFQADALIIGSPIYFSDTTSQFHAVMERLGFTTLSYDDYSNYFTGTVNFGMILTMNAPQMIYDQMYAARMEEQKNIFARSLNGRAELLTSFDTLQVADYSKYSMGGFSEEHKKSVHENQFPQDLKKAFEMGVSLLK